MANKELTKQDVEKARHEGAMEIKSAIVQLLDLQQYGYEKKMVLCEDFDELKTLDTIIETYEKVIATIRGLIL